MDIRENQYLRTATTIHGHLHISTKDIYKHRRTSTRIYERNLRNRYWTATNIYDNLWKYMDFRDKNIFTNIYEHPRTSTNIYEHLRKSKKQMLTINEHLRETMTIYGHPRKSIPTNIDEHPRTSTNIYEHLQTSHHFQQIIDRCSIELRYVFDTFSIDCPSVRVRWSFDRCISWCSIQLR